MGKPLRLAFPFTIPIWSRLPAESGQQTPSVSGQHQMAVTVDGKKYMISYYPISGNTTIYVPSNRRYEMSGNNIDGVIVTVLP
jgi:hypothetical protein